MAKTRSQEDEPVPQWFSRWEEAYNLRFSRYQEENDQKISQLQAMVADYCASMKRTNQTSGYDHFERFGNDRRFGVGQFHEGADDDEEQYLVMDEELAEIEADTKSSGIEDRAVENEANSKVISAIVKKEQIRQIQVSISKLERGLRFHNASSIVCEDSQYVVGCDELCEHQMSTLQVSHVKERNVLVTESASVTINQVAHQLFDKMLLRMQSKRRHIKCHKSWRFKFKHRVASRESKAGFEVNMKHNQFKEMLLQLLLSGIHKKRQRKTPKYHKSWKFRFKPTSKRSRLMDDKFSFVDATVLLNKDPKKTMWDCVKKELKETMAACEKNRVDRFKLAEEKESKLQVLDLHQTFMCHQIGRVWEPGGLPNKMDLWDWFETELKACGESQQVEMFLYSLMQVVKRNLEFKTFESNKTFSDSDIASFIGLGGYNLIATYLENKKTWMFKYKAPNLDTKVFETSGQCIRKRLFVSADHETEDNQLILRFLMWVLQNCLHHYMVLLLTPVAYDAHFSVGVSMNKKQSHLSLWINRVWDPGRSLVKDASYSTRIFSSLPATAPVSLICQESFAYQITSFSTNLEVKVSLKEEDLIQDKRREKKARVARVKESSGGHVGEANWLAKKNWDREHLKLLNRGKLIL